MVEWWVWVLFVAVLVVLLLLDLLVFHQEAHRVSTKEAAIASAAWIGLGLAFAVVMFFWFGLDETQAYLTGYLIEKSLSVDNLFVFVLIFSYFKVPNKYQHRVLFWGILGAFVFRGLFIAAGAALLNRFSWIAFIFGAFLVFTAYKLATQEQIEVHPEDNPVLNFVRRFVPLTKDLRGQKMFVRDDGQVRATPLFAVLVVIETTDIIFAVDSIPAIFGVTRNAFTVFSSNAFALLGLRALYFLLADLVARFRYLDKGLALILGIIGVKLIYEELVHLHAEGSLPLLPEWAIIHIPAWAPLVLVAVVITVAVVASLRHPRTPEEVETAFAQADHSE